MTYTVGQMAKMLGLAGSTLRYYDKEGLLPFVERSSGGIRMFREKDYEWLQIIECLKKAGMSIKDIKKYIVLLQQGDSTIQERLELFQHQRIAFQKYAKILRKQFSEGFLYIYISFFLFIYLRLTSNFFASALVSRLMPRTIISRTTAIPNATPNSPLVALR